MPKKPIVARVNDSLHRAVKMRAAEEGKTMTEIVKELLEKWVEEQKDEDRRDSGRQP